MVTVIDQRRDSLDESCIDFESVRKLLERAYSRQDLGKDITLSGNLTPLEMRRGKEVGALFARLDVSLAVLDRLSLSGNEMGIHARIQATCSAWRELEATLFQLIQYDDVILPRYLDWLNGFYPLVQASFYLWDSYRLIIVKTKGFITNQRILLERHKYYAEGFERLSECLELSMKYPNFELLDESSDNVFHFSSKFIGFYFDPDWVDQLGLSKRAIKEIKAYIRRIKTAVKAIQYDVYRLNTFIVDSVGEDVVYLDPDSAEGKALQRISVARDDSEDDFFDEDFDVDELLKRIDHRVEKEAKS